MKDQIRGSGVTGPDKETAWSEMKRLVFPNPAPECVECSGSGIQLLRGMAVVCPECFGTGMEAF